MGLATTLNANEYDGNGSSNTFAYAFKIRENSDLIVTVDGSVLNTGYTVTGAGSNSGGAVIFDTPPNSGNSNVSLVRSVPLTQLTSFPEGNKFPSSVVEETFDYAMMVAQQLQYLIDTTVPTLASEALASAQAAANSATNAAASASTAASFAPVVDTWIPSVGGTATYSLQTGHVVKVGKLVFVHALMTITTIGNGSTTTIFGLPYLAVSDTPIAADGGANLAVAPVSVIGLVISGAFQIDMMGRLDANSTATVLLPVFGNGASIRVAGIYQIA